MILKLKDGASAHGFLSPEEAGHAGFSSVVFDRNGPVRVYLPFAAGTQKGVTIVSPSDLWRYDDVAVDCIFAEPVRHPAPRRSDLPRDPTSLVGSLREFRDMMLEVRRCVKPAGPADHAAAMVVSAIDGFSAFIAAPQLEGGDRRGEPA